MTYLKMPLQLQSAVAKKLQRCSYQESIAQHIMLLILSHHGEVIGREDFGSMIWDLEFNQLVKISDWEEGVKNSLIKTIEKYEKRLRNVDVNVTLLEIEEENIDKVSHIRRKAQITVTGTMDRTNDVVTTEDAKHVRKMLKGILVEERIIGVETGACPHTAVREDPSMNIAAVEEMEARFPDGDVVLIESGGDNLTLTFSPALVDFFIYVIDVAAGDKIPRKDGPGISQSDILVINKTDLAPYVRADLEVMRRDSELMRPGKPFVFTNCMTGEGIDELVALIRRMALFDLGNNKEKVSEPLTGAVR